MRVKTLGILAAAGAVLALSTVPATAQVTVIGGGLAGDCYDDAKQRRNNLAEAIKTCTRALETESMNVSNRAATYTNRGVLRMRSGRYDAALNDYAMAKRLKSDVGAAWLNEGAALILKKDFSAALISLDQAIALNTMDLYAAHYNRAIARENTGDVQGAYKDFQKVLSLNPDFEPAKRQLTRFSVKTN
ncbi:MAG: tetratricopeptide repeat protein [Hyphomonas sp.]